MNTKEKIIEEIRKIYDPELPVNIYELGLIYDIQVKEIVEDFLGMIKENPDLKSDKLKEDEKTKLMCLSGVKQYPMRVKCATLSWHTLISAIDNKQEEINTEN